jgi:peroxiredoxin
MKMLAWLLMPMFALAFSVVPAVACPTCGCREDAAVKGEKKVEKEAEKDTVEGEEAEEEAPEKATIDKKAPDCTLKNASGDDVKLSDYKDKIVVLEWINFDCPIVQKHYKGKTMQDLAKDYRDDDIVWLQICSSAEGKQGYFTGDDLTKRIEKEGCDAKFYLIDADGAIGTKYGAKTTPHMYVIDKEGKLRYQGAIDSSKNGAPVGEDGTNYLKDAVTAVKDGKEVTTKETKPYGCSVKYADAASTGKRGKN